MHMHTRVRERALCVHTHGATARQRARGRAGGPCHGYARYGYLVCACELVEQEGLARVVQAEHAHHRGLAPREGVPVLYAGGCDAGGGAEHVVHVEQGAVVCSSPSTAEGGAAARSDADRASRSRARCAR